MNPRRGTSRSAGLVIRGMGAFRVAPPPGIRGAAVHQAEMMAR